MQHPAVWTFQFPIFDFIRCSRATKQCASLWPCHLLKFLYAWESKWKERIWSRVWSMGRIRVFHLVKNSIGNNSIGWLVGRLVGCLKITIRVIHVIQENLRINMNLNDNTNKHVCIFLFLTFVYSVLYIVWVHEQPYSVHTVWILWFIYPFNSRYLFFLIWWYRKFNQEKK